MHPNRIDPQPQTLAGGALSPLFANSKKIPKIQRVSPAMEIAARFWGVPPLLHFFVSGKGRGGPRQILPLRPGAGVGGR